MKRRAFLRSIAKGVFAAVATVYAPRLVESDELVDMFVLRNMEGAKVGALSMRAQEAAAFMESMNERMFELSVYGTTTFKPSEVPGLAKSFTVRWQQPAMEADYGKPPGMAQLEDVYGLER